jgi:ribosomal protein S18 acetylase RimI-like enzyme
MLFQCCKMQILPAILNDVETLVLLVNSAYRGESSRKGWTTEADFLDGIRIDVDRLAEMIQRKDTVILKCIEEQNEIVGCVHLEKHQNKLYLGMLTVSPELQNKGIGKKLLEASELEAKKFNCTSIYMTVITERVELIAWYERHGYVNTKKKKPFPMNDSRFGLPKKRLEFVVLEKMIASPPTSKLL